MITIGEDYEVSISILAQLLRYVKHLGINEQLLFSEAGLDFSIMNNPDNKISLIDYLTIEDIAVGLSKDPCFGLHMGEFAEPGSWSITGYMMMNCRTLGQAFEKSGKYSALIGNVITGKVVFLLDKIKINYFIPRDAPVHSRHCYESAFASTLRIARTLTGKPVTPIEVGFSTPQPENVKEYYRVFGCPVYFNKKKNYMIIKMNDLSLPILTPNDELRKKFESFADDFLTQINEQQSLSGQIKKIFMQNLGKKQTSIGIVSRELGISTRTLQNNLKHEGTSFREIRKETCEQLAKKFLKENYTIEEITFILGFSDPSVFQSAFKKWTGLTPRQYRLDVTIEAI